mmetsp:Transcript_16741/g.55685  ORF Transcript_16741/g.55685 Transcript_16741/m.55685 type:complete len:127 (-) Transcript_16741:87-467(-)
MEMPISLLMRGDILPSPPSDASPLLPCFPPLFFLASQTVLLGKHEGRGRGRGGKREGGGGRGGDKDGKGEREHSREKETRKDPHASKQQVKTREAKAAGRRRLDVMASRFLTSLSHPCRGGEKSLS